MAMKTGLILPNFLSLFTLIFVSTHSFALADEHPSNLRLWYKQPAAEWVEALPVGNGSLGAMVFGRVVNERIQFNEDTLWTGVPRDYINPKAKETLPKVRALLFEGKQREAERVAMGMMSIPLRQEAYQPFGDIYLEFPDHQNYTDYQRELDIQEAIARVEYQVDGVTFQREIFSGYPDQVLVIRLTAAQPRKITMRIKKSSPHSNVDIQYSSADAVGHIKLHGQMQDRFVQSKKETKPSVLRFESQLRVEIIDGQIKAHDENITIENSSEVILKLAAATSYKNFRDIGNDPAEECLKTLEAADGKPYESLKQNHIQDYQNLFNRMSVDLGTTDAVQLPADQRIQNFDGQNDPQLIALYYQFGRYLLISSSRPGSQSANLQGIWNQEIRPPWESKWTTNINTEMNYWPAEMCNLSECHEPLFAMLDDLTVTGAKVAEEHYGCRGWVLHHNTDIWRGAAPINASNHGIWMTGGAWLCQHLWFRYSFTQDEDFLRNRAYPIMKKVALFFVDFLVEDPETGWLISTPSNSPEIGGLVAGPSMDHQIIRNLFSHCITASEILNVDHDLREQLKSLRERIAPNQIGQYGQLQEWLEDKDDPNNHHRHISHLWALHPGNEITPLHTPKLAKACKVTLQHRGDGGTGWSKAWKVNFWARLLDGNHAYKMLTGLLSESTLPNMFDTHPPFQIDGNFGGTSGITEMLIQSHTGEIHLLPALPDAWPQGYINGVCARGGFTADIEWQEGKLINVRIHSKSGKPIKIRYQNQIKEFDTQAGETYTLNENLK